MDGKEIIETANEIGQNPMTLSFFKGLKDFFSKMLNRNQAAKEKLAEAIENKHKLEALQSNLDFMEKWNNDMKAEIEAKEKEIDNLAKQAGWTLDNTNINKALVGNTMNNVGKINIGDGQTHVGSNELDIDKIVAAIEMMKKDISIDLLKSLNPSIPQNWLEKLEKVIKG